LDGALNMTDSMEALLNCLTYNKVPENWAEWAYFCKKPLITWYADLLDRIN